MFVLQAKELELKELEDALQSPDGLHRYTEIVTFV